MTFSHEAALPPLPLPKLESLREWVPQLLAPLADEATRNTTAECLEGFLLNEGPPLYQKLGQWKEGQGGNNSWLLPLWDRQYLAWRGALPVDMNYFFFLDGPLAVSAGTLAFSLAAAIQQLFRQTLPPETTKAGPLSMRQFRSLIYTRLPLHGCDSLLPLPPDCALEASVVCKGQWFILPLTDASGTLFAPAAIDAALDSIRAGAAGKAPIPVGGLTAAPRDRAAAIRDSLLASPCNQMSLRAIEQTAFTLCLDQPQKGRAAQCLNALCGLAENRWFDKSLQIICPEGGPVAMNFEHAGCDAAAWGYLLEKAAALAQTTPHATATPVGRSLDWNISSESEAMLRHEARNHAERAASLQIVPCELGEEFCKNAIKAMQCSPDAFVQLAIQCAQYSTFGSLHSCYEAFSMRAYAGGRTECARPSSPQALALARAVAEKAPQETLAPLLAATAQEHGRRLAQCRNGQAVERLIFGLKNMHALFGAGTEAPAFFADRGLALIQRNRLSTSGVAMPAVGLFGFGPVEEEGLGAGYTMRDKALSFVFSAYAHKGPELEAFAETLVQSMRTLAAVLKKQGM